MLNSCLVNICGTYTLKVCIGMCVCVIQGKIKENWYVFCLLRNLCAGQEATVMECNPEIPAVPGEEN